MADTSIFSLDGKIALVTGVTNTWSLAWGCAQELHVAGAQLLFTYQGERVKKTVSELAVTLDAQAIQMDVTQPEEVEAVFKKLEEMGGLDILLHAIAYAPIAALKGKMIDNTTLEGFRAAMEVSAFSLVQLSSLAAPLMARRGGGSIIALTYLAGEPKKVVPGYNVMSAAKAALNKFAEILAVELGPLGIRVNVISSGAVKTASAKMIRGFNSLQEITRSNAPLRRTNTPQDVGRAAVFLASDAASAVTGVNFPVDCGAGLLAFSVQEEKKDEPKKE